MILKEDESKHVLHLSLCQLDTVRWNHANQDEVACTSVKSNEVLIFDIGYVSSEPIEVLRTKHSVTVYGTDICRGLTDVAFTTIDKSRLIASDTNGMINVWDRRIGVIPCLQLTTGSNCSINSIELNPENQVIFGAGRLGVIYAWDLRGGRVSSAFQNHKELSQPVIFSCKLASMLQRISPLKEQSNIVSKEVHSIDIDPSCSNRLAFHLDDGWSGVLDTYSAEVTHVHCPPPAWLNDSKNSDDLLNLRKPTWLPSYFIYVVGSPSDNGIHLLDFHPDCSSPCHVDNEDESKHFGTDDQNWQNRFLPLSQAVTVCASHPLNGTIIAGTKNSSLLLVSQRRYSTQREDVQAI